MSGCLFVFTPTWVDEDTHEVAVRAECEASIKSQVGVDFDWHVTTDNPHPIGDLRNVLHQYQQAREWFLQHSEHYDAFLAIEHDNMLPDTEAIQRLLETPGDVVYAPYMLRHGSRMLNTWQYINDWNLGMSLSNYRKELQLARDRVVHRISGAGFGCTLIRRHVLEALEFTSTNGRDQNHCPDLRFAEATLRKGFTSYGRFDVPVLHFENGQWLHPFSNRRNRMNRYIALQTVRALTAGRVVQLEAGAEIELTAEEAIDLSRLGYIRPSSIVPHEVAPPEIMAEVAAPARTSSRPKRVQKV